MDIKPLHKRWLVFEVPYKQKIPGSILYTPNSHRDSINGVQKVWLISHSNEIKNTDLKMGDCCYVYDGFDLLNIDMKYDDALWEQYKDHPAFAAMRKFVDEVDGIVKTKIVSDGSLLAVEE